MRSPQPFQRACCRFEDSLTSAPLTCRTNRQANHRANQRRLQKMTISIKTRRMRPDFCRAKLRAEALASSATHPLKNVEILLVSQCFYLESLCGGPAMNGRSNVRQSYVDPFQRNFQR